MPIHYYRLPTCHCAPWLLHIYWWEDLKGQDSCWEENSTSIQITVRWADSRAREAGKEGTTKSHLHRWVRRVCRWRRTSRNYWDNCIICQGRVHPIPLGHLQPRRASHRIHIQAGRHCLCNSFYWTAYLSRGRRWDRTVPSGWIQEHSWKTEFPAISVIMANWQRYLVPCRGSGWPFCTPCCCLAPCGLSTRLAIPSTTAVCSWYPLRCRETGTHIILFATWCSLCPHHEADSRAQSPVCIIPFFLWFGKLECQRSLVCFHVLLHV